MEPKEIKTIVSESIAQLLLRHNCVIIPNLGGFIGNYTPSKIMLHTNKVVPPSKALLFNNNLVNNDGLLIQHLAEENYKSYQESQDIVNQFVSIVQNELQEGHRYEVEHVGFLFLQSDKQIGFEQDHSFNLYMNSFGFGSVRFVTFEEEDQKAVQRIETPEVEPKPFTFSKPEPEVSTPIKKDNKTFIPLKEVDASEEKTEKIEEKVINIDFKRPKKKVNPSKKVTPTNEAQPKKTYKWRRYVAAAAVLPIVFYSLWIPMKSDVLKTKILHVEDFNPFYSAPVQKYEARLEVQSHDLKVWVPEEIDFTKVAKGTKNYNIPFIEGKMIAVLMDQKDLPAEKPLKEESSITKPFHLIAGCFGEKANANALISQLKNKGFDATIVDYHKGLYRVSALQATTKQSAIDQKSKLENAGFSNWVLEK